MAVSPVYLYILMRTDLASMNSGKAMAQATHAANQCIYEGTLPNNDTTSELITEWQAETGKGFGTCILLGVKEREMRAAISMAEVLKLHSGIAHDPSYPLKDGETTHFIPLDTCAYVFGRKVDLFPVTHQFSLMP